MARVCVWGGGLTETVKLKQKCHYFVLNILSRGGGGGQLAVARTPADPHLRRTVAVAVAVASPPTPVTVTVPVCLRGERFIDTDTHH